MSEVAGVKVPHQAKLCILGIYPDSFTVSSKQSILIDFGLLQARRMIALSWKNRYAFQTCVGERDGILCCTGEVDLYD